MTALRVLIVDDEPPARRTLREMLAPYEWIGEVLEAGDGLSASHAIAASRPDLVFLDIRMPGKSGLDVLREAGRLSFVVFTTAHEEHALDAFELEAFDYLLKPFGPARFTRVMQRVREAASARLAVHEAERAERWMERLFVRRGTVRVAIPIAEVERLEGCDDYVVVHAGRTRAMVTTTLTRLAARLDPRQFIRVHRSHVVNLDFVTRFESRDPNRVSITMANGDRVQASRAGSARLRQSGRI